MLIAHIWRGKMGNKYSISEDRGEGVISISLYDGKYLDGFIDIWVDDGDVVESPFENMDTARAFAEIIVKLLEQIS